MLSAPMICSPRLRRPNRCSSTPAFAPPKAGRTPCMRRGNRIAVVRHLGALVGRSRYRGEQNSNGLFYNVTSNPQWEGESINKYEVTVL
jgi:hypothetical protein